jgi:hypothetical protein
MSKIYRTAQGKAIDLDKLSMANENEIAVGNMKVNARGDELGPGGQVIRTRDQVMREYYQTNAVYTKERVEDLQDQERDTRTAQGPDPWQAQPADIPDDILAQDAAMDEVPKLRGNLADAVAKSASVDQKLMTPKKSNSSGPSRI